MQIYFNRIIKSIYLHLILIIIISTIAGHFYGENFNFDASTLYWAASTIAQTFGALLALTWAISMYHSKLVKENFMNLQTLANKKMNELAEMKKRNTPEFKAWFEISLESEKDKKENKEYLYTTFGKVTNITLVLIIMSIAILGLTHNFEMLYEKDFLYANRSIAGCFIFLFLFSGYCLVLIMNRMAHALSVYLHTF